MDAKKYIAWINDRLVNLAQRPEMHGSQEAVELQWLMLLEFKALVYGRDPKKVKQFWHSYINETFDERPLSMAARKLSYKILVKYLKGMQKAWEAYGIYE